MKEQVEKKNILYKDYSKSEDREKKKSFDKVKSRYKLDCCILFLLAAVVVARSRDG